MPDDGRSPRHFGPDVDSPQAKETERRVHHFLNTSPNTSKVIRHPDNAKVDFGWGLYLQGAEIELGVDAKFESNPWRTGNILFETYHESLGGERRQGWGYNEATNYIIVAMPKCDKDRKPIEEPWHLIVINLPLWRKVTEAGRWDELKTDNIWEGRKWISHGLLIPLRIMRRIPGLIVCEFDMDDQLRQPGQQLGFPEMPE